jgi:hypothetical protein
MRGDIIGAEAPPRAMSPCITKSADDPKKPTLRQAEESSVMSAQGVGYYQNRGPPQSPCWKGARPVHTTTRVRARVLALNHNEALMADRPRKLCRR